MIRTILLAVAALAPWFLRRRILAWQCAASFGPDAYVGRSFIDTQRLVLGRGARIGSLNCFRRVCEINLEDNAGIGNLNWFSGASHMTGVDAMGNYTSGSLLMGEGAALTNRHYVDMHGNIEIGRMALVAGVRSTLLTHSIDFTANRQTVEGIKIGAGTFVATNAVLLPGTRIPGNCIVAAGGVVTGPLPEEGFLYGGVPAKKIKPVPADLPFFIRRDPFVE